MDEWVHHQGWYRNIGVGRDFTGRSPERDSKSKKLAMAAMGAITVGAVGLTLTVAMVGRAEPPSETVPVEKVLVRGIGPDGRVQGAFSAKLNPQLVTMTYFVGDLVSPAAAGQARPSQRVGAATPSAVPTGTGLYAGHRIDHVEYCLERMGRQ